VYNRLNSDKGGPDVPILRNTKILSAVNLFISLSLFAPIEVLYLQSLHIPMSLISILNLSVPIVMVFMDVPAGILADYLGRKKIVFLSILSFFFHMALLLVATETWQVFVAFLFEGIGWALYSGNTDAIVVEESIAKKTDISRQLVYFYSGLSLGPLIAGFFNSGIGLLGTSMDYKLAILISVIMRAIALVLIFFVTVQKDTISNQKERLSPKQLLVQGGKHMRNSFSLSVVVYEATGRLDFFLPVIFQPLAMRLGMNIVYFGILYSLSQLLLFYVQKKADVIISRLGMERVLFLSPILLAVGVALFLVPSLSVVIIGYTLTKLVGPLRNQCLTLKKNEFVENKIRATYLSIISSAALLINSAYLSLSGLFLDSAFSVSICLIVACTAIGGLFFYRNIASMNKDFAPETEATALTK
jgi:MFS family permease